MQTFGVLLRGFRQRCKDPDHPERVLSQERFGELVGKTVGGRFSGAAVSDWERGVSKVHADHRPVLMSMVSVLHQCGGLADPKEANAWLETGNYRALDPKETGDIFPNHRHVEVSHREADPQQLILWPPGIPNEEYYSLPHRDKQLAELLKLLESAGGPRMISVDGLGGMGKTALASELARRSVEKNLFQGVIGETAKLEVLAENEIVQLQFPVLGYEDLLNGLARQLQLWDLFTMDVKSKETVLAQALHRDRYLVFVDNLETVENVNVLVARLGGLLGLSRAIITSRVKVHLDPVHSFTLDGLSSDDSLVFMKSTARKMGVQQVQDVGHKTLLEIFELTGGSPLAMKLAVAQAKFLDLGHILIQMGKASNNLYFFIFKESWTHLSESAQSILVYIGRTVIDTVSFQELSKTGIVDNEDTLIKSLEQLISYSLLSVSYINRQIRYGIHQLTRQFIVNDLPALWKQQGLL